MARLKSKPKTITLDMVDESDLIYLAVFWSAPEFILKLGKLGLAMSLEDYQLYRSRHRELSGQVRGKFDNSRYIKYLQIKS